ncbi:MAG: SBBP repeat-containing protein [Desulfobacterales bacterium]|nr:SBBP repeat-containing protein [Desulfobacterales bacterium]
MKSRVMIFLRVLAGLAGAGSLVVLGTLVTGWIHKPTGTLKPPAPEQNLAETPKRHLATIYGRLPLYFIENRGQLDRRVLYYARGSGHTVFFTPHEVVVSLFQTPESRIGLQDPSPQALSRQNRELTRPRSSFLRKPQETFGRRPREVYQTVVRMQPVGMNQGVKVRPLAPQEHRVNYFRGSDPQRWLTDLPTYQAVLYEEAYKGIDLKFYGNQRHMEYDVVVKPGADPGQVRFAYRGVKHLEVTPGGDLALHLPGGGVLLNKKPVVYQEIAGTRVAREARFRVQGDGAFLTCGFDVAAYDRTYPLVIDPVLVYSTYLGGSRFDVGNAIAVDAGGFAYVTGYTYSGDFPKRTSGTTTADVFVAKLNAAGNALVYVTFFASSAGDEEGNGIAVDFEGNALVTGFTNSKTFPVKNAFQTTMKGGSDAFVAKLNAAGNTLVYSSFLGGDYEDAGHAIAVDQEGNAYVAGETANQLGYRDVLAAKIDAAGGLTYAVSLTGSDDEIGRGIAVDRDGNAYLTGGTNSGDFPATPGVFQTEWGGGWDAFVAKLNPAGETVYATYLGGSGDEQGRGITLDPEGGVCVTGFTESANFPTHNPMQPARKGSRDAFVTRFTAGGTGLVYSTYLGEGYQDEGCAVALDAKGNACVAGSSLGPGTPEAPAGFFDAFVTRIDRWGSRLGATYLLGGSEDDWANGVAVDPAANLYVTGETWSGDFPTKGAYQTNPGAWGNSDCFVSKLGFGARPAPWIPLLLLD